jgi:hypothetical protein
VTFGFDDHPELPNPARALTSARIGRKDRPKIVPFRIQDAEVLIAAIQRDWGEAQATYDEFRFFTGCDRSEQIALTVHDCNLCYLRLRYSSVSVLDEPIKPLGVLQKWQTPLVPPKSTHRP